MSTPAAPPDATPGFRVKGTFYPFIAFEQWDAAAAQLARRMIYPTPLSDLMSMAGNADVWLWQTVYAAVAMFIARDRMVNADEVIDLIGRLRFDEITLEGFTVVEDDALPPGEEAPESSISSENGEPSSESNLENSPPETYGSPPTPTGLEG